MIVFLFLFFSLNKSDIWSSDTKTIREVLGQNEKLSKKKENEI